MTGFSALIKRDPREQKGFTYEPGSEHSPDTESWPLQSPGL